MMDAYLEESGIRDVRVVTLKDGSSESWALDNLLRKCSPDVLFLSTERNTLARLARNKVTVVRFRRTGPVSSSLIRQQIASGDPRWRKLTGKSVGRLIEEWDGPRRIREAFHRAA